MKTYMALDGQRWSRGGGSVHCNMPRSAVFGRPGGRFSLTRNELMDAEDEGDTT